MLLLMVPYSSVFLSLLGSDGNEYPFLLKGHEDLRQDERVMQLFRLVNKLLGRVLHPIALALTYTLYTHFPLNSSFLG